MKLRNQTAIVTGGARGIGRAIALLFAREGAHVVIWDMLEKEGHETLALIEKNGGSAHFVCLSVTDRPAVESAAKVAYEHSGSIDILINNAGILRDKTLLKMTDEQWAESIAVNLSGVFICTRAVVPYMKEVGYGRIVSASSTSGVRGNFGQANYAAAKAGIVGFTKTLALELGRYGITANAIAPGYTKTAMTDSMPEEIQRAAVAQIPVGFAADPEDIAYGYLCLATEEARFISGQCLAIDGGYSR